MNGMNLVMRLFLAALVFLFACGPPAIPPAETKTTGARESAPVVKAAWEQKWEAVVAEARKEGSVVLYTIWVPQIRTSLTGAFKDRYGIDLEISPFSRGSDMLVKVQAEQRAGLYLADIFGAGGNTFISTMKPVGLLGQFEPLLMLPEVTGPGLWLGDRFPFVDKDKLVISMMSSKQNDMVYNTDLVKPGEITTYKDMLKPQYKGKITINDPTITGVAAELMAHLAYNLWSENEALDFLRQLVRHQEVVIQRDPRIHIESVARGKFAVGLAARNPNLEEFLRAGAPLEVVKPKEGFAVATGSGALAVPTRRAHPNAATVFVNWLLSKEGQTVFSKGFGSPSTRKDVPAEELHPIFVPKPGEKLYMQSEESIVRSGQLMAKSKKAIDEAMAK